MGAAGSGRRGAVTSRRSARQAAFCDPAGAFAPETPMSSDRARAGSAYHSAEEILAHPRFAEARIDYLNSVLALYEGGDFLPRLTVEAARQVVFIMIVSLDAGSDPDDPATWPTL